MHSHLGSRPPVARAGTGCGRTSPYEAPPPLGTPISVESTLVVDCISSPAGELFHSIILACASKSEIDPEESLFRIDLIERLDQSEVASVKYTGVLASNCFHSAFSFERSSTQTGSLSSMLQLLPITR